MTEKEKKYSLTEEGNIKVEFEDQQDLAIPYEKSKIVIGRFNQKVIQIIETDKIDTLLSYLKNLVESSEASLEQLEVEYNKYIDFDEKILPLDCTEKMEKVLETQSKIMTKYKGKKAIQDLAKTTSENLKEINVFCHNYRMKNTIKRQIEDIKTKVKIAKKDFADIKSMVK